MSTSTTYMVLEGHPEYGILYFYGTYHPSERIWQVTVTSYGEQQYYTSGSFPAGQEEDGVWIPLPVSVVDSWCHVVFQYGTTRYAYTLEDNFYSYDSVGTGNAYGGSELAVGVYNIPSYKEYARTYGVSVTKSDYTTQYAFTVGTVSAYSSETSVYDTFSLPSGDWYVLLEVSVDGSMIWQQDLGVVSISSPYPYDSNASYSYSTQNTSVTLNLINATPSAYTRTVYFQCGSTIDTLTLDWYETTKTKTFTSLSPNTSYRCRVWMIAPNGENVYESGYFYVTTKNSFAWTYPKVQGGTFNLTATEWNAYTTALKNKLGGTYTTAYTGNNFTANMFNEVSDKLYSRYSTRVVPIATYGMQITATYMNDIVTYLNNA